jgi:hypothetical protein
MTVVILEDAAEDRYELEDEVAYVYAILDLRRDPLWIRNRLQKRR